ncbi:MULTISPECIES: type I DNA topoisomerase [unclassified Dietzia]|uniref:type I DNA topoisomerase n=1 Tax=unclassified Dietzia TaxID=2617939 RepID=UPI0015F793A0|nr:type I DNA topoisomerase [Dietzia sp. Cai40]MBB1042950.1 type I DNA topoisomerase [Dietzia sp. DQ11-44]
MASKQTASGGKRSLVIVESATKARKIQPYLGSDYVVEASVGHIRDLPKGAADIPAKYKKEPWARLGVNPEDNFEPIYVVSADKKKKVAELKKELAGVDQLLLATDPDREGEAIAWHLLEVLKPKVPVKRMVFHEITKPAILAAAENTRELDTDLVDAQETRRILDRLYGYEVSPVLWKKVMPRLSAGRVQSVATRVIVERERERMAFVAADYWDITATLTTQQATGGDAGEPRSFTARLAAVDGARVAQGRDFGQNGRLKTTGAAKDAVVLEEAAARALSDALDGADFVVDSVESKPYTRRPYAPFMTSTLQQEAGRKLRYTSERTMRIAQRLYENGYITYMRTDSTTLSEGGMSAARAQATELYGSEYVSPTPRQYTRKVKNSQEAHEAIRPAGESFATPGQLHSALDAEEYRLYELIWQRTVASQMADAKGTSVSIRITGAAGENPSGYSRATFAASGRTITFPGFLKAYVEAAEESTESSDKPMADDAERRLPRLSEGQALTGSDLSADGHTTSPPARYNEASLVKVMEEMGIGRPSTYASIIRTIQDRGYVYSRGNALVPSWVAFAVIGLLEQNFGRLVDYDFTSLMEDELDEIAEGRENRDDWLRRFYFGDPDGAGSAGDGDHAVGLKNLIDVNLEAIDARSINSIRVFDDSEGRPVHVRVGRYGPYLERMVAGEGGEQESQRANLPEGMSPDELTLEVAEKLFATPQDGRPLGVDPETGHEIVVKDGRFGPYVTEKLPEPTDAEKAQWARKVLADAEAEKKRIDAERDAAMAAAKDDEAKAEAKKAATKAKSAVTRKAKKESDNPTGPKPRTGSLMQSMEPATVTLEQALKLLSLPRVLGVDPTSGEEITAQLGRYGPYLRKGTDSRTLDTEDAVFTITLEEALKIYSEPKRRGRQAAAPKALREMGVDEVSGKQMLVKDGRFGPYVTDGESNASLRKGDTVETLTDARASELLSERRAKSPPKKAAAKKAPARKSPAKKSPAKKATAGR